MRPVMRRQPSSSSARSPVRNHSPHVWAQHLELAVDDAELVAGQRATRRRVADSGGVVGAAGRDRAQLREAVEVQDPHAGRVQPLEQSGRRGRAGDEAGANAGQARGRRVEQRREEPRRAVEHGDVASPRTASRSGRRDAVESTSTAFAPARTHASRHVKPNACESGITKATASSAVELRAGRPRCSAPSSSRPCGTSGALRAARRAGGVEDRGGVRGRSSGLCVVSTLSRPSALDAGPPDRAKRHARTLGSSGASCAASSRNEYPAARPTETSECGLGVGEDLAQLVLAQARVERDGGRAEAPDREEADDERRRVRRDQRDRAGPARHPRRPRCARPGRRPPRRARRRRARSPAHWSAGRSAWRRTLSRSRSSSVNWRCVRAPSRC